MAGYGYNNRKGLGFGVEYDPTMRQGGRMERGPYRGDARYRTAAVDDELRRRWDSAEGDAAHEATTDEWREQQRSMGRTEDQMDQDILDTQDSFTQQPGYEGNADKREYEYMRELYGLWDSAMGDQEQEDVTELWRQRMRRRGYSEEEIEDLMRQSEATGGQGMR